MGSGLSKELLIWRRSADRKRVHGARSFLTLNSKEEEAKHRIALFARRTISVLAILSGAFLGLTLTQAQAQDREPAMVAPGFNAITARGDSSRFD